MGVRQISLADTVGVAAASQIEELVEAVRVPDGIAVGVHLHATRAEAADKVRAAYGAGCRRFDAALGGLGGCPFAQDALVGNLPTEVLMETLRELGVDLPGVSMDDELMRQNAEIGRQYGHAEATV
jgi:hydroxymethylglutaryl-CoA lyase